MFNKCQYQSVYQPTMQKNECHCKNEFMKDYSCYQDHNNYGMTYPQYNAFQSMATPLVAPKRLCVQNTFTPIEQPVICPVECRRVNVPMVYPKFYPYYQHTTYNQCPCQTWTCR